MDSDRRFTGADIIMADVLRQTLAVGVPGYPNIRAYIERACASPAFKKAYADQLAHFAAGDRAQSAAWRPLLVRSGPWLKPQDGPKHLQHGG